MIPKIVKYIEFPAEGTPKIILINQIATLQSMLEVDMHIIKNSFGYEEDERECIICLRDITKEMKDGPLACGHKDFHLDCIL